LISEAQMKGKFIKVAVGIFFIVALGDIEKAK
jgi:hypothetical protein